MGIRLSFYIILYIIIFIRIVWESLGIIVSNDLFLAFYIFVYLSSISVLYRCRSPPVSTNLNNSCWLEVFILKENINEEEIECVVKQFKKYMKKMIPNLAIDFARKYKAEKSREISLEDYVLHNKEIDVSKTYTSTREDFRIEYLVDNTIKNQVMLLNEKEKMILEDIINKVPIKVTAQRLRTTENYIKKLRNVVRNKIKFSLKGERYGRQ